MKPDRLPPGSVVDGNQVCVPRGSDVTDADIHAVAGPDVEILRLPSEYLRWLREDIDEEERHAPILQPGSRVCVCGSPEGDTTVHLPPGVDDPNIPPFDQDPVAARLGLRDETWVDRHIAQLRQTNEDLRTVLAALVFDHGDPQDRLAVSERAMLWAIRSNAQADVVVQDHPKRWTVEVRR